MDDSVEKIALVYPALEAEAERCAKRCVQLLREAGAEAERCAKRCVQLLREAGAVVDERRMRKDVMDALHLAFAVAIEDVIEEKANG